MAYAGGYAYGYQDGTGFLFTPTTEGRSHRINKEQVHSTHGLWRKYGAAIRVQAQIVYTSGASALLQTPAQADITAADTGSGIGDKMIYRTPTTPQYPITETEALVIIADETYADFVSQP